MTNMTEEDLEVRLRAVLRADATRAPVRARPEWAAGVAAASRRRRGHLQLLAPRRTRLAVAAGLVVVMAAGLSAGLSLTGGGPAPLSAPASAAELLARAATVSAAQPVPRAGQYIYTEATGISPESLNPAATRPSATPPGPGRRWTGRRAT